MIADLGLTIVCVLLIAKEVLYTFWNVKKQAEMAALAMGRTAGPMSEPAGRDMRGLDELHYSTLGPNQQQTNPTEGDGEQGPVTL